MLRDSSGRKQAAVIVKVCVSMCLKYACVYTECVIHSLPRVSQGGQSDSVTWWALVAALLQRADNSYGAVWHT